MSLHLILGPMFSGKSSEVLGTIRKYKAIGWPTLVITNTIDMRYSDVPAIISHNSDSYPAIAVPSSGLSGLRSMSEYTQCRLLIIEEAQFFSGLKEFVLRAVEVDGKDVLCVGLDGDIKRKPFGELLELVPFCNTIVKKHAFCSRCSVPTEALFTSKRGGDDATEEQVLASPGPTVQVQVGGAELYEPLCRKHYLESNAINKEG